MSTLTFSDPTLLDAFAGQAMQAMLQDVGYGNPNREKFVRIASAAYMMAEEMIRERSRLAVTALVAQQSENG